jgi:hypothetical protein
MKIQYVKQASIGDVETGSHALITACGYEHRSQGITSLMEHIPADRHVLCFSEFAEVLARKENEDFFRERGFHFHEISGNNPRRVREVVGNVISHLPESKMAVAFDISTMTRSWHGAIVQHLRLNEGRNALRTFFAYAPAVFQKPHPFNTPNEFVAPVEGFASLSAPDLPVAAVIGLGYVKEGALGLQQLLDPELTVLLVPHTGEEDEYFPQVLKSNRDIMARTPEEWVIDYSLADPAGTFAMLASPIGGLRPSHRIVLASLGPKIFGLICFLLATEFPDVSVWRISSGIHGHPRDSYPDLNRTVVLDVIWEPETS